MRRSQNRFATAVGMAAMAVVLGGGVSEANWPMGRHDSKRTGTAMGKSDMVKPVPYWRAYLGGSLALTQFVSQDVDGDGTADLIFASSGSLVAKQANDGEIWRSEPRGVKNIVAVVDLDGDGTLEIVAASTDHAMVFAASTGKLLWVEPDDEMGTIGRTLVADLNGDGKPEVVTVECTCCGVNSGKTGFVRSFAAGATNPTLLWTLPASACSGGSSVMALDIDGDGKNELLVGLPDHFQLLRGSDGMILAETAVLGTWIASSVCTHANLDGAAGDEVVCALNSSNLPQTDQRKAFVIKFDGTSVLKQSWKVVLAPDVGGTVGNSVPPIADLDGDGTAELLFTAYDPGGGGWSTRILNVTTGADLVPALAGQQLIGMAATEAADKKIFLTSSSTSVTAWTFVRTPTPAVTQRWTLADRKLVTTLRPAGITQGGFGVDTLRRDLNGDGLDNLLFRSTSGPPTLYAYSGAGGVAMMLAMRPMPEGVDVLNAWTLPAMTSGGPQLALARTDGILNLLDSMLVSTKTSGEFPIELGIRVGGYYAAGAWRDLNSTARSSPLKTGDPDSILATDSRGALLRFDPKDASWAVPPPQTWSVLSHTGPVIVPGLDGAAPGIACIGSTATGQSIDVLHADGTVLWSVAIENNTLTDLLPGKFDGDAVPDLAIQWGSPGDVVLHTRAYSGADGHKLWDAAPVSPGAGRQAAGLSATKWDGDDRDDVCLQGPSTQVLSGVDGTVLGSGGATAAYGTLSFTDLTGDGADELIFHGGFGPIAVFPHNLGAALFTSVDDDRPYPYGAIAQCASGQVLVEGSWENPARLKLTTLSGGTLGAATTMVLAHGQRYADETAALAGGAFLGLLTSAVVHQNLTGTGRPTALVGSVDGNLYAINPCDGTLDFTVPFSVAVGEPTFADTDGDGRDEIIVGAADGYLYGLKNENVAAPMSVVDLDPDALGMDDVDAIIATDRLAARWSAVAGATSYAVNAVDDKGVALTTWTNVGTVTQSTIGGLKLAVGGHYVFAVRAIVAKGPSVDVATDGVDVLPPGGVQPGNQADGGTGGGGSQSGCGCRLGASADPRGPVLLIGLALLGLMLRRRRSTTR